MGTYDKKIDDKVEGVMMEVSFRVRHDELAQNMKQMNDLLLIKFR